MKSILMICHGNICRSTMAEFVMKNLVKCENKQQQFLINSAGTSTEELGNDTHYGTKAVLKEHNIPFEKRRARKVTKQDYDEYDLLICMDKNNVRNLQYIIGEDKLNKIKLLLSYTGENRDIADPWYTGNFDKTYEDVTRGCKALFNSVMGK